MTLAGRLRAALARSAPDLIGEDDYLFEGTYVPAAVLIAITDRAEPGVVLTLRQASLRRHAGQIAFPGGRIDPEDADPEAAALREAREEIGLAPERVEVVGGGDSYRTGSGYRITSTIGVIPPDLPLVPHEAEVAAAAPAASTRFLGRSGASGGSRRR